MAQRRRKKRTTKRRTTRRASTSTRRRAAPKRKAARRRRRRRNPSIPLKGVALAFGAGLLAVATDYALRGVPSLSRTAVGAIEAGGLGLAGAALSMYSPPAGLALLGAGVATGGSHLVSAMIEKSPTTSSKQLNAVRARVGGRVHQLNAVQVPMGSGRNRRVAILS